MIHLDVDKIANDFVESVDETLEKQRITEEDYNGGLL